MDPRYRAFALALVIVVLDRITKLWIQAKVSLYDVHNVIPGLFDIVHTENKGMAFGLFSEGESTLRTVLLVGVASVVLVFVVISIWRTPRELPPGQRYIRLSLGLILGGAVGNLYDRIVRGSVTDFLDIYVGEHHWPAFNVADSAITIGAVLLALDLLLPGRAREPQDS
ncbi:MAG: signal peptidase II [bacterium]|nr:signal peptidase II [bacterium]